MTDNVAAISAQQSRQKKRREDFSYLLIVTLLVAVFIAILFPFAEEQALPVDQFAPSPDWYSWERLASPIEINRFNRQYGIKTQADLRNVHFHADGLRGWAVGGEGAILATSDGGRSWARQNSNSWVPLSSITFLADGRRGWAVGGNGSILATSDGGRSWARQTINSEALLSSITFLADGLRGWVVGEEGNILVTTDGGRSWARQASNSRAWLESITFLADGQRGWAVGGNGTILATADGGRSWKPQVSNSGAFLSSIVFLADGQRGWAVGGNGTILSTTDGGRSWAPQVSNSDAFISSITFLADGLRGWAVEKKGAILSTTDGGLSWGPQASNAQVSLRSLAFLADGQRGWAVGEKGTILATADGGRSWAPQVSNAQVSLRSIVFLADGQRGWAVGDGGKVFVTADGGRSWGLQASNSQAFLLGITFLADGLRGWAVGGEGTILATSDGGRSWKPQASNSQAWLQSITFLADGQRGWIIGENGTILATTDGGRSWVPQASNSRASLQSIAFLADGQRGWAVTERGAVLATANGGRSWEPQAINSEAALSSASFLPDGLRGWIVGLGGTILATIDGGRSWKPQVSNSEASLSSITFLSDGQRGWAAGEKGTILATSDGGGSWERQATDTLARLHSIIFLSDGLRGWAVGDKGTILVTADGGRHWKIQGGYQHLYAPWFWLVLLCLLVIEIGLCYLVLLRGPSRGILSRAVSNAPITREWDDRLGFAPLAQALSRFIRHEQTRPPLTVAVTAPWGKGKSSLLRLLELRLKGEGVQTVWFNVWHHQHEPVLLAPLLNAIIEQGIPPWWSLRGLKFRYQLVLVRLFQTSSPLLLGIGVFFFGIGGFAFVVLFATALMDIPESGIHPLVSAVASLGAGVLAWLWDDTAFRHLLFGEWKTFLIQLSNSGARDALGFAACIAGPLALWWFFAHFVRPFPASPSALLSTLAVRRFSLRSAEEQTGFRERFARHFRSVCEASERLTIFIDDLDRCDPAKTAELLECINYLSESGNCRIIIGAAQEIVELQVGAHYGELAESKAAHEALSAATAPPDAAKDGRQNVLARRNYARDYLRKLFQLSVPVPEFTPERQQRLLLDAQADTEEGLAQADWEAFKARWLWLGRGFRSLVARILPLALLGCLLYQANLLSQSSWETVSPKLLAQQSKLHAQAQEAWAYIDELEKEAKAAPPKKQAVLRAQARDLNAQGKRIEEDLRQLETLWREQRRRDFAQQADTLTLEIQAVLAQRDAHLKELRDKRSKSGKALAAGLSVRPEVSRGHTQFVRPASESNEEAAPWSLWSLIPFGIAVAVLGVPVFFYRRERKRVIDSPEFAKALTIWGPLLLSRPHLCSPREGKRFVNLARYLSLRINLDEHNQPGWIERRCRALYGKLLRKKLPALKAEKVMAEEKIVALAALYLARPEHFGNAGGLHGYLQIPNTHIVALHQLAKPKKNGLSASDQAFEAAFSKAMGEMQEGVFSSFSRVANEAEVTLFLEHVSDVAFNG